MKNKVEIEYLKKRILIFCDFFISKYGDTYIFKPTALKNETLKDYSNKDYKSLRDTNKENNMMLREMPLLDALELRKILKKKLNEDIDSLEKKRMSLIKSIIKKGKINNHFEFELMKEREEELFNQNGDEDERIIINSLLVDFLRKIV